MSMLNKVILYLNIDGTFDTQYFNSDALREGQTEDDFIEQESARLILLHPHYGTKQKVYKTKDQIRQAVMTAPVGKQDRKRIKIDANGNLFYDPTAKIPREILEETLNSVKSKLMSGSKLNENEAKALLKLG